MRVLFLTQVIPWPPDAGAKVRAYYTIKHLSRHHEITLVSFVRHEEGPHAFAHLHTLCSSVHTVLMKRSWVSDWWYFGRSVTSRKPFLLMRDQRRAMERVIEGVVVRGGPFDVIHADQLYMAPYALFARALAGNRSRTILDQHNAVFRIPERLAQTEASVLRRVVLRAEARKLCRHEVTLCNSFDHVVWVTALDCQALANHGLVGQESSRGAVIPIATEPPELTSSKLASHTAESHRRRVTFLGGLHWPPNAEGVSWFIETVWPMVKKAVPDALLTIIGRRPSRPAKGDGGASIEYAGHVDNLDPYLRSTAVFVVPLLSGGGMRVKILDAWGWALPVVSTSVGAEGLMFVDGHNGLLADTSATFTSAVTKVLRDPVLAARLGAAGRRTVEDHYDWRKTYAAWDEVYGCAFSSSFPTCPA